MSEFEQRLAEQRRYTGDDYRETIMLVAEGIAELIELIRPAVDAITVKPEPLRQASTGRCAVTAPGALASGCVKDVGHGGMHTDALGQLWNDDTPMCWETVPEQCVRELAHPGNHRSNSGTEWPNPRDPYRENRCTASQRPGVRCVKDAGHGGKHSSMGRTW